MTIYEIKARISNQSHYFDRETLKFFKQTLKMFKVLKQPDGRFYFYAPLPGGRSYSERFYNPVTNTIESK